MHRIYTLLALLTIFLITSCATPTSIADSGSALCQNKLAKISADFPGARANKCRIISARSLAITIDPENKPINSSAWYGFKITPKSKGDLHIHLQYSHAKHRYPPKISYDGVKWNVLDRSRVKLISKDEVHLRLNVDIRPFYIAAQEIMSVSEHNEWIDKIERLNFVTKSVIGSSIEKRPIYKLEAQENPKNKKPFIVLVGRQHPPEVTGAMALMPFVETVLGGSDVAQKFRKHFNVIIIPNMNPDGVTNGHWRHNMAGVDLNRDWGPFTQPETQAVANEFNRFKNGDDDIVLFLDFHSTWRNLLYTQTDAELTNPSFFTRDWLAAVDEKLDAKIYKFTREQSPNSGKPVSKNYMYSTYNIPAITYEVGDNTNRKAIRFSAKIFAQEMMKTLLMSKDHPPR